LWLCRLLLGRVLRRLRGGNGGLFVDDGVLVGLIHCLHAGLVGLGMLLLDELLNERQTLAPFWALGLDFRYRELRLDIHLLELQGGRVPMVLARPVIGCGGEV
jgi:hypothetical protein